MPRRFGWLVALAAALGCSQAFAQETWTCRHSTGDDIYEDNYLIVDDRVISTKGRVVMTTVVNDAHRIRAYYRTWTAHEPPIPVYFYFTIDRRSGWTQTWSTIDSASLRVRAMPILSTLGSCTQQ